MSTTGADPDILLGGRGSTAFQENLTRKNKKENNSSNNNKRPGQIEGRRLFQHLVHMVHVQRVSLRKGRKGRRHGLCVIVSPYIHNHIFNRIVFDFSKCVDDGRGDGVLLGSNGVILETEIEKCSFIKARDGKLNFCDDLERGHVEKI